MKYYWNYTQVTREVAKQYLQEELDMAKDEPYFMGRIFYDLDYLERCAKERMRIMGKKSWEYFSLTLEVDAE